MLLLMQVLKRSRLLQFSYILLAVAAWAAAPGKLVRDWEKYPAVVEFDPPGDVWAIGDAHGDYERLMDLLAAAKLVGGMDAPANVRWTGGNATLVMTGDMIDKGPRSLDVLRMVRALQISAAASGGRAIILMGNHETEFMADPGGSKSAEFEKQLHGAGMAPAEVAACRTEIGEFLCTLPFGARVGDWFFSHGGNTAGRTIVQLKKELADGFDREGFSAEQLIGPDSILEARLTVKQGKKGGAEREWTDAGLPKRGPQQLLEDYAAALGVHHIVEGHQPSEVRFSDGISRAAGEMFQRNGLLFLIDTGMSRDVDDSYGATLHIQTSGGKTLATGVCADGKITRLWEDGLAMAGTHVAPCGK